ncbi:hypothetical protein BGZ96_004521 [Linnemannia gamsii]|uniref:chitin synthase n=1 Tax=Linnemannia gamsii TaxID=64522 RepID=A0ABQ7KFH2_9FUNG|nr:hypothetical protein BGZ96_004521 [Linnemannia gamsii]
MPFQSDYTSPDLTHLGSTSDDAIVYNLSSRWKQKLPYTRINASTLVAVNPYEVLSLLNDAHAEQYADQCYRNVGEATSGSGRNLAPMEPMQGKRGNKSKDKSGDQHSQHSSIHGSSSIAPHPFELAGRIYLHLRRTAQLCRLATHTKKESRVASQLQQAQQILDAFGCAFTKDNMNASMFSKFLEIQFNERGRILGGKTLCYLLNVSRITKIPQDERTFHVFYYLMHANQVAFSDQDKSQLRLQEAFAYISQSRLARQDTIGQGGLGANSATATTTLTPNSHAIPITAGMGTDDTFGFEQLKRSMSACGFKPRQTQHVWRLLAAILHLGNLQFADPASASKQSTVQEAASIRNPDVLDLVADILGVPSDKLMTALTYKSKLIRRDLCTVVLNSHGAIAHRDSLAKTLYLALFGYLVEQINKTLCHSEPANFVALLDQPGLTEAPGSSAIHLANFEQFSVNFANELLHGFVGRRMLDDTVGFNKLQIQDGIQLPGPIQRANTNNTSGNNQANNGALFDNGCLNFLVGKNYKDDQPLASTSSTTTATSTGGSKNLPYSVRIQQQQQQQQAGTTAATSAVLGGLVRILDDSSALFSQGTATDADCLHKATVQMRSDSQSQAIFSTNRTSSNYFAIQHFTGKVEYSVDDFLEKNLDQISPDFLVLLRNSANRFIVDLFSVESAGAISVERHPKFEKTIVKAQLQTRPKRQPSRQGRSLAAARRGANMNKIPEIELQQAPQSVLSAMMQARQIEEDTVTVSTVLSQVFTTVHDLAQTMDETTLWHMVCLKPNETQTNFSVDTKKLRNQVNAFLLPEIAHRKRTEYTVSYVFSEFLSRYEKTALLTSLAIDRTTKTEKGQCLEVANAPGRGWNAPDGQVGAKFALGNTSVWLAEEVWKDLEDDLRTIEKEERLRIKREQAQAQALEEVAKARAKALEAAAAVAAAAAAGGAGDQAMMDGGDSEDGFKVGSAFSSTDKLLTTALGLNGDDAASDAEGLDDDIFSDSGEKDDDMMSDYGMASLSHNRILGRGSRRDQTLAVGTGGNGGQGGGEKGADGRANPVGGKKGQSGPSEKQQKQEPIEELPTTRARKLWVAFTWAMTWWIPSFMLSSCGKMTREDIRMAWREKVALCCIIFFMSAIIIFVITGFGKMMCPGVENLFSSKEVGYHASPDDFFVSLRGIVYDITKFAKSDHSNGHSSYPSDTAYMLPYAGMDVTEYFPLPLNIACYGLVTSPTVVLIANNTIIAPQAHGPPTSDPTLGWSPQNQNNQGKWYWTVALPRLKPMKKGELAFEMEDIKGDETRKWFVIENRVYDLTSYYNTVRAPGNTGAQGAGVASVHFLDKAVEDMAFNNNGEDVTDLWEKLPLDSQKRTLTRSCLEQVFFIGKLDYRKSFQCQFTNYMLLSTSVVLVSVIAIKFLAALQLGSVRVPEEHDKFVIVQIPCYTEDEDSLRKTIDSIASLRYDDKRKLLFIICDGMIIGSGNDLPTPRIVLNILGHDPSLDPEPLAFKSIGDGSKQMNMGKIYSGLYEHEGHVVPYIVVAKVGQPSERSRPGNRGKRDSQIILMKFLNKVHFDSPMCPLELEIYHQMKNVIGVNPSFYEYILQVDADTEVMPDALNRLISCMIHDGKIIGLCGETQLGNEENSWTTMIQVYEYYISHHLAKAFESLFGSVTCLPGCFCMYRVRTVAKSLPLIISSKVIEEYSDNSVDTLHKKNLLSLGEDRYLTTLMMKHFPQYKMTFTPDATCKTVAPDRWSVLLSQRRRWINSTVHNLAELMFLPEMCGFCCFSMRFVVFLDLFGTLTLPASVIYLVYLIVIVATGMEALPKISLILLGAVYGLQALIFIIKRQWQHIGWMFIYILAIPLFSFFIPVYSFWHFDDFSWGNTRMVVGETGNAKKVVILGDDEETFDEKMIPMKKWSVYEQEMWEIDSVGSHESKGTVVSYRSKISEQHGPGNGGMGLDIGPVPASPMSAVARSVQGGMSLPVHHLSVSGSQDDLASNGHEYYRDTNVIQKQQQQQQYSGNTMLQQYQNQYHRHQGSRSSLAFDEDMRRASVSSLPRSVVNLGMIPRHAPSPSVGGSGGVGPYGHRYQESNVGYDSPQQFPPHSMPMQSSPMVMYNHGHRMSISSQPGIMPVMGIPGPVPYAGSAVPSLRGGGGSQYGSGSVVGAPLDVGYHAHGGHGHAQQGHGHHMRSGSTASAGVVQFVPPTMGSDQPTDEELANEIQNVLATADLMSITKKQVRERLMAFFGVDLTSRKEYINEVIERVLES